MDNPQVQSVRDDKWLDPVDDAPDCNECGEEMYERDSEHAGSTPTSPSYSVLFECPECGYRLRANRRR